MHLNFWKSGLLRLLSHKINYLPQVRQKTEKSNGSYHALKINRFKKMQLSHQGLLWICLEDSSKILSSYGLDYSYPITTMNVYTETV